MKRKEKKSHWKVPALVTSLSRLFSFSLGSFSYFLIQPRFFLIPWGCFDSPLLLVAHHLEGDGGETSCQLLFVFFNPGLTFMLREGFLERKNTLNFLGISCCLHLNCF